MNKYTYITVEDVPTLAQEKQMYVLVEILQKYCNGVLYNLRQN